MVASVQKRDVDGLLLLDKPRGLSSNHALQKARRAFRARKAGHGGTLDPLATGMLLVCFGKATRLAGYLLDADKRYRATLKLGETTSTADSEGEIIRSADVPSFDASQIEAVLAEFVGEIEQVPPMYSALKHQGVPLYRLARQGVVIDRPPRRVHVRELELHGMSRDSIEIEVSCSKGLYVRTLAQDIGERLGCGAHLSALRRTSLGDFGSCPMHTLDEIESLSDQDRIKQLLPPDRAVSHMESLSLDREHARAFCQGQRVNVEEPCESPELLRCYSVDGSFLGLGRAQSDGSLAPKAVFA